MDSALPGEQGGGLRDSEGQGICGAVKRGKSEGPSINFYTNFKAPLISDVGFVIIFQSCFADLYSVDSKIREDFGEF